MRKKKYYKKKSDPVAVNETTNPIGGGFEYCKKCMYAKSQCICNLKFSKSKQLNNKSIDVQEYKEINSNEDSLQKQCEGLLDSMKIEYYRIPEDITRLNSPTHPVKIPQYLKNLITKYFKGKPDLLCLIPHDDIYIKAVAFELKTKKGTLNPGQKEFQRKLPLIIIRSFEQFQECLNSFLDSGKPPKPERKPYSPF